MAFQFASRTTAFKASAIRELLKLTAAHDMITFGGGLPPNECFPLEKIATATNTLLNEHGAAALQYSTTEGSPSLRAAIAARMHRRLGAVVDPDNLLITTGSQQVLDLTGKVFLDEGDIVFCETPTYLAAITAFRAYGATLVSVPSDDQGMIIPELEKQIVARERRKLIYVIPDFQNPSGRTWSLDRRMHLLEIAERYDLPVLEDAPYRDLRFDGEDVPALVALDRSGHVIFTSTFSKVFSPGLRIGWIAAPPPVVEKYVLAKQAADLHTSTFAQMLLCTFMQMYDLDAHIATIRATCRERRDAMIAALAEHMPADVRITHPAGGLFLWVELPAPFDTHDWLRRCLAHAVAFAPGDAFYPDGRGNHAARICFSDSPPARIAEGVRRMAAALREIDVRERLAWKEPALAVASH